MALPRALLQYICGIVLFIASVNALKFEMTATSQRDGKKERCIRNFVARDTLVVVTAIVSGSKGDGQILNMHIRDTVGNEYGRPRDVAGEQRTVFTSHADAAFDVCFENTLSGALKDMKPGRVNNPTRHVELDIDIGADAKDWSAIQATEKLRPVETELRRYEEMIQEIVTEMDYLRAREQKLRDTNESTNTRVKWFGIGTTTLLIVLWGWQIMYLRAYFRSKHLI
ncbi:emp24/gp25L/p24 family/GOLD-domain-containing protein [Xylaria digitata]|nr:emp24/gp25L/p24 family/GOLD-domain-containing protein [Xylaria digitata]